MVAGGITEGVPGLAELVEADAAEDESMHRLYWGPGNALGLTPLTEETEADLRSSSYAKGASTTGLQSALGEQPCSLLLIAWSCQLAGLPTRYAPKATPSHHQAQC